MRGEVIGGRYRLHEELGRGGMAVVYRATDVSLGRDVAVKVLKPEVARQQDFIEAFRREASALGLDPLEELVRQCDFTSASGYRETCALLALTERPTAIVAASDLMALAALQAIRDAGLQPGRDLAVVGFDDLEAAALAHPPLTTIRQDRQELGTLAAARAIQLIEDPERTPPVTLLPVELVVRGSSS